MSDPKLHHYVPQFYLRRFADPQGRVWVWDKSRNTTFPANPSRVAAETNFYRMQELKDAGYDPNTMEKQFADLEAQISSVTEQWLDWFTSWVPGEKIDIPESNREAVSLFITIQYLRTADTRDILCALSGETDEARLNQKERTRLHTNLLWDLETVHSIRDRIKWSVWVFGRNQTDVPFITSDNPVCFRTPDNRQWVRLGFLSPGTYAVYPLSPDIVMFCHDRAYSPQLARFDSCLSPVKFDRGMVQHENSGQVFMASRFVFSQMNAFEEARDFASSIGTDRYKKKRGKAGLLTRESLQPSAVNLTASNAP